MMFNWLTNIFRSKKRDLFEEDNEARERSLARVVAKTYAEKEPEIKVRARDAKGRWLADDPETEQNEAYK